MHIKTLYNLQVHYKTIIQPIGYKTSRRRCVWWYRYIRYVVRIPPDSIFTTFPTCISIIHHYEYFSLSLFYSRQIRCIEHWQNKQISTYVLCSITYWLSLADYAPANRLNNINFIIIIFLSSAYIGIKKSCVFGGYSFSRRVFNCTFLAYSWWEIITNHGAYITCTSRL